MDKKNELRRQGTHTCAAGGMTRGGGILRAGVRRTSFPPHTFVSPPSLPESYQTVPTKNENRKCVESSQVRRERKIK
jgi:hypothetical protein